MTELQIPPASASPPPPSPAPTSTSPSAASLDLRQLLLRHLQNLASRHHPQMHLSLRISFRLHNQRRYPFFHSLPLKPSRRRQFHLRNLPVPAQRKYCSPVLNISFSRRPL